MVKVQIQALHGTGTKTNNKQIYLTLMYNFIVFVRFSRIGKTSGQFLCKITSCILLETERE